MLGLVVVIVLVWDLDSEKNGEIFYIFFYVLEEIRKIFEIN